MCPSAKKRKPFLSQHVHEGNGFSVCQCGICVCSEDAGRLLLTKAGNDHSRRSKRYGASTVFHLRAMAGGCAVAGRDVDVQAVQAVRAVVAVGCSRHPPVSRAVRRLCRESCRGRGGFCSSLLGIAVVCFRASLVPPKGIPAPGGVACVDLPASRSAHTLRCSCLFQIMSPEYKYR